MDKPLFRNWDNSNKYIKAPYQGNVAKIGHLEFLFDYLNENSLPDWVAIEEGYNEGQVVFSTNAIYRSDVDNNTTTPPSSSWTKLADISTPYSPPYKVYSALLNQDGTVGAPPVATVLENTLGDDVEWIYDSVGGYFGRCVGKFTDNKTAIFTGQNYDNVAKEITYAYPLDVDNVYIDTRDDGVAYNGSLINTFVEIRVYE